jgi:hypothetical protein
MSLKNLVGASEADLHCMNDETCAIPVVIITPAHGHVPSDAVLDNDAHSHCSRRALLLIPWLICTDRGPWPLSKNVVFYVFLHGLLHSALRLASCSQQMCTTHCARARAVGPYTNTCGTQVKNCCEQNSWYNLQN